MICDGILRLTRAGGQILLQSQVEIRQLCIAREHNSQLHRANVRREGVGGDTAGGSNHQRKNRPDVPNEARRYPEAEKPMSGTF